MNVYIDARDNRSFVAIVAFPNEWLSFFNVEKFLKTQDTVSWPPARRAYASERIRHVLLQKLHWHPASGGIKRVNMLPILVVIKQRQ